jgi:phosphonate transport system substrate-binding protein
MTRKVILVLMLVAVGLMVVPATMAQDLGTAENPIQVYFVPSVEADFLVSSGDILKAALNEATGLEFEVFVPTSYAATIEAMCAAPGSSMGFIPAQGYVLANNRCGAEVAMAAVRRGWAVYWSQYLVRRDSDIYVFGDLDGKTWAYPDAGSTSGYLFPLTEMTAAGITPGELLETGGHPASVLAVYNGEADFATAFYSAPLMPGAPWAEGDLPEPWDLSVDDSYIGEDGNLYVGDIRVLDARAQVRETAPDVIDQLRILRLTDAIPNDTMSFGPDFPVELRQEIMDALVAFSQTEAWADTALGSDMGYEWSSLAPITDSAYDGIRLLMETQGITEEDVFGG